ncbi:hypothetical protein D3C81_1662630 [compost metagenome]
MAARVQVQGYAIKAIAQGRKQAGQAIDMQQAGFVAQHDALRTGLGQPRRAGRIVGVAMLMIVDIGQGGDGAQAVRQCQLHRVAQALEIQLRIDQHHLADAGPGEHPQPAVQRFASEHINTAMGGQQVHRGAQGRAIGALAQCREALQRIFTATQA